MRPILASTTLLLALAFGSAGHASTIFGDTFSIEVFNTPVSIGTLSGTADENTGLDINDFLDNGFLGVEVNWADEDSVDVTLIGAFSDDGTVSYALTDLDFMMGGDATPIQSVSFNRSDSNIDEFVGDTSIGQPPASAFSAPTITSDSTSFTATLSSFPTLLQADGVRLRYDVSFATTPPVSGVIPLPAAFPLLFAGLGGLMALRRRA